MSEPDPHFNDAAFISDELKKQNRGLYLCSLYVPENKQDAVRAIYALFLELKKIPETISEPMLGQIRTTWWRELIEHADPETVGAPLAREIIKVITAHKLDKELFFTWLEAFTEDLYIQHYENEEAVLKHYDESLGVLFLILSALLEAKPQQVDKTHISTAARALGIALSLYETPIALQRLRHYLPLNLLQSHGGSEEALFERKFTENIAVVFEEMSQESVRYLELANQALLNLDDSLKPAFLSLCQVRPLLKQLKKTPNPLNEIKPLSALSVQWHLWRSARKGQF